MALLRMITVEASRGAVVPGGLVFHWTAHHVREIFLACLPPKYVLNGSAKVRIACGPRGGEPQHWEALGVTHFFVENFDFAGYVELSPERREEVILKTLHVALRAIATRAKADCAALDVAESRVRSLKFRLRTKVKRLSRVFPRSKVHVDVFRVLSKEDGEAWEIVVQEGGEDGKVIHQGNVGNRPDYLDRTDMYKTSEWEGGSFVMKCRLGQEMFRIDVGGLIASRDRGVSS